MLVNAKGMLDKALAGHYAVPHFNINDLEWAKSVLLACEEVQSPVILGVSEGAGKYMTGFKTVAAMVKAMVEELGITVPVALHLDHGTYDGAKACIEAGFTSVMFDGSHYDIDENVEKTKELVKLAHEHGCSLEAEVGGIGGVEIPDVLVVIKVGSFDRICGCDSVSLVFIINRQVCQMSLKSPVRRRIHTGRGKCALDAQFIFLCSNIFHYCF